MTTITSPLGPTSLTPPCALSASKAARLIREGALTSEQLVESCLSRIATRDTHVSAWEYVDADQALNQARERDRQAPNGPLYGVPVGIKDTFAAANMPTLWGESAGRYPWDAPEDSWLARRLREAGAILIGKTSVSRHAMMFPGKTRNPHDLSRTPGVSSGGSAAAVADFMVPIAFGSQTGGSIIRPASYCGVVGYMMSHGSIPLDGSRPYSQELDTAGVFVRDVDDLEFVAVALGRSRFFKEDTETNTKTVGLYRTPHWPQADPAMQQCFDGVASTIAAAGFCVKELAVPPEFTELADAHDVIMGMELRGRYSELCAQYPGYCAQALVQYLEHAARFTERSYQEALKVARAARSWLENKCHVDVILTPSTDGEAPVLSDSGRSHFQRTWTLLHAPAVTIPVGVGPHGLPLGLQIVGSPGSDGHLFAHVRRISRAVCYSSPPSMSNTGAEVV